MSHPTQTSSLPSGDNVPSFMGGRGAVAPLKLALPHPLVLRLDDTKFQCPRVIGHAYAYVVVMHLSMLSPTIPHPGYTGAMQGDLMPTNCPRGRVLTCTEIQNCQIP